MSHSDSTAIGNPLTAYMKRAASGLALCCGIAALALGLHLLPGFSLFSPMIVALVGGLFLAAVGAVPTKAKVGLDIAARPLLRFAIILLGFQLTLVQITEVGLMGMLVVILSLVSTLIVAQLVGVLLGIDSKLAQLIAVGTAICGASAIVAMNAVTKANDEDVTYAVACITLCGTIAMLSFPLAISIAHLDSYHYGLWTGAAIHEVGQVVGAAFQGGQVAGEFGTITKLSRVIMLVPVIMVLGQFIAHGAAISGDLKFKRPPLIPLFILIFLGVVALNSAVVISPNLKGAIATLATFFLTVALGATGLVSDIKKLRERGAKPLLLGLISSAFIAVASLGLLKALT